MTKLDETTAHFAFNLTALVGLFAAAITFAAMGDALHSGEALSAFVGFAAGSRSRTPGIGAAAGLICAGAFSVAMQGCGASLAQVVPLIVDGIKWTVEGADKLCDALDSENHEAACRILDTLTN